jgi:hypothetical protein
VNRFSVRVAPPLRTVWLLVTRDTLQFRRSLLLIIVAGRLALIVACFKLQSLVSFAIFLHDAHRECYRQCVTC